MPSGRRATKRKAAKPAWPVVIRTAEVPPGENRLRREFRQPRAYAALRDRWVKTLRFGTSSAVLSRQLRETARRHRMIFVITVPARAFRDQDNADSVRKFIQDAAQAVGYCRDDSAFWLKCVVVRLESETGCTISIRPQESGIRMGAAELATVVVEATPWVCPRCGQVQLTCSGTQLGNCDNCMSDDPLQAGPMQQLAVELDRKAAEIARQRKN